MSDVSAVNGVSGATTAFRAAYAAQRAREGRAYDRETLLSLPWGRGAQARDWAVRARTYEAFMRHVLLPLAVSGSKLPGGAPPPSPIVAPRDDERGTISTHDPARRTHVVRLLDLGAGNGWLSWRAAAVGCECVALDLRDDDVDGLGAAAPYLEASVPASAAMTSRFTRVAASFDALPIVDAAFDVVAFNASLHYACDLATVLREARRVARPGGRVVVLDSPFYARESDGAAMVNEKRRHAAERFGEHAAALMALPAIEFLTRQRLTVASRGLGLAWRRRRVRYPLWYELRPLREALRRRRRPSRFDLWEGVVA